jgi:hypothetical protein
MRTFKTLSFRDKLRVARYLVRGEAPVDQKLAVAAIELAESYRRQGRVYATVTRWMPWVMLVVFGGIAIPAAFQGDVGMTIAYMLLILVCVGDLIFNPVLRPKNVARSLEASRRAVAPTATSTSGISKIN